MPDPENSNVLRLPVTLDRLAVERQIEQLQSLLKRPRGRPAHPDSAYLELLLAWQRDILKRPSVPAARRRAEFVRKGIPEKCGLKLGPSVAIYAALARGRRALDVLAHGRIARRQRRSLLDPTHPDTPVVDSMSGPVKLVPKQQA